eukprot:TRINITY_DN16103_c0_g1_i2.p1 TRINITY_DN16103_c0_g1~~TRINITY_DN16103_c0_g1_i2.p1  ORF type:complete len:342 (+),score=71.62 TRINITY_DN16103_c0_g1_i2:94-1026(+)
MAPQPCAAPRQEDDAAFLDALGEFFVTRLVRREHRRSADTLAEEAAPVAQAAREFRELLSGLLRKRDNCTWAYWERACSDFSTRWTHVSHWCCPTKLAGTVGERIHIHWADGPIAQGPERAPTAGAQPAQPHLCTYCNVICNSAAQCATHVAGSKHQSRVARVAAVHAAQGLPFVPLPPQPVAPGSVRQPPAAVGGRAESRRRRQAARRSAAAQLREQQRSAVRSQEDALSSSCGCSDSAPGSETGDEPPPLSEDPDSEEEPVASSPPARPVLRMAAPICAQPPYPWWGPTQCHPSHLATHLTHSMLLCA